MTRQIMFLTFYLCLYIQNAGAQTFPDLKFSTLTLNTTIPNNFLTVTFKDSRGLMWFGTENSGLLRYDGKKVKSYYSIDNSKGISANHISFIAEDKTGWLWISTLDGLYHFDPVTEKKVLYRHDGKNKNSLADNEKPRPFIDSRGRIWVSGVKGLQQFDAVKKSFINYTIPFITNPEWQLHAGEMNLVFEDTENRLWGGSAYGLYLIDTGSQTCKAYYTGIYRYVTGICQDKDGQIWVSFWGGGLKSFYPATGTFKEEAFGEGVVNMLTLWKDANNKEWLCFSVNYTFTLFDPVTKKSKAFPTDVYNTSALQGTEFRHIYNDNEKRLWILSNKGIQVVDRQLQHFSNYLLYAGIYKEDKNKFGIPRALLKMPDGYQLSIWARRQLYFYDNNWQLKIKGKNILPYSVNSYASQVNIMQYDDEGNIWYGTDSGLVKQTAHSFKCYMPDDNYPLLEYRGSARNIVRKNSDEVWVRFVKRGVYVFNTKKERFEKNYRGQFPGDALCMNSDKKGLLWLGTSHGLYGYKASLDSFVYYPIRHIDTIANTYYNYIQDFLFDDENIGWLATYNGLIKFNPADGKTEFIVDADYPAREPAHKILEDTSGTIWVETNTGLTAFNKHNRRFNYYSKENGLPSEFAGFNGVFNWVDDTTTALGSVGTITTFNPYKLINNTRETRLYFSDVMLDGKRYALQHKKLADATIVVEAGTQNISLHFAFLNYTVPQQNKLYYRLSDDKENAWVESTDGDIIFLNLAPGTYVLYVKGNNKASNAAEAIDRITIIVRPHWYQSLAFRIFILLATAAMIYLFIRWRLKSVRKAAAMKQQITKTEMAALKAQMNPHFMFNCINSIDAFIQTNDKYNATLYLNKFAKLIRNVLDSSKQNLVSFSKDIDTLKLYIELEELRSEAKFKTSFNIDEELLNNDYLVPPLIAQPFVENAIIHGLRNREGNVGLLNISIKPTESRIVYTVTDNGIGRKEAKKKNEGKETSYGMQMSYDRIKLFNKEKTPSIEVHDLYEDENAAGTTIIFYLNKI